MSIYHVSPIIKRVIVGIFHHVKKFCQTEDKLSWSMKRTFHICWRNPSNHSEMFSETLSDGQTEDKLSWSMKHTFHIRWQITLFTVKCLVKHPVEDRCL